MIAVKLESAKGNKIFRGSQERAFEAAGRWLEELQPSFCSGILLANQQVELDLKRCERGGLYDAATAVRYFIGILARRGVYALDVVARTKTGAEAPLVIYAVLAEGYDSFIDMAADGLLDEALDGPNAPRPREGFMGGKARITRVEGERSVDLTRGTYRAFGAEIVADFIEAAGERVVLHTANGKTEVGLFDLEVLEKHRRAPKDLPEG